MTNSPFTTIALILLMVVAFYFLIIRPQKKRQQAQQKTMSEIQPGTRVLLGSGIFGTVISVGDKQAVLETAPGAEVTVLKQAIARVIQPGDEFSEPAEVVEEIEEESIVDPEPIEPTSTDDAFRPTGSGPTTSGHDRPAPENPTFGNEPKNKD